MVASDLVSAVSQAATAALLISGQARLWQLLVLQAVSGGAAAFFGPAATGLVPEIVAAARLQQANALRSFASSTGGVAGPALAGVLVATVGSGWALAADAASFAVSAVVLSLIRLNSRPRPAGASMVRELVEGWHEYLTRGWLVLANINATLVNVFVMAPLFVLGPAVARDELGGAGAWALIVSCFGLGSVAGSFLSIRLHIRHRLSVGLALGVLWAPLLALLALHAPAITIAPIAFLGGIVVAIRFTFNQTTTHEQVPAALLSRVTSFGTLGSIAFAPVGFALTGLIAAHLLGIE
jgi:MFS family permease